MPKIRTLYEYDTLSNHRGIFTQNFVILPLILLILMFGNAEGRSIPDFSWEVDEEYQREGQIQIIAPTGSHNLFPIGIKGINDVTVTLHPTINFDQIGKAELPPGVNIFFEPNEVTVAKDEIKIVNLVIDVAPMAPNDLYDVQIIGMWKDEGRIPDFTGTSFRLHVGQDFGNEKIPINMMEPETFESESRKLCALGNSNPDWKTLQISEKFGETNPIKFYNVSYRITDGLIESFEQTGQSFFKVSLCSPENGTLGIKIPRNYPYDNSPDHSLNLDPQKSEIFVSFNEEINTSNYGVKTKCFFVHNIEFSGSGTLEFGWPDLLISPFRGDNVKDDCIKETVWIYPPLKQFKSGIAANEIICKGDLILQIKNWKGIPVCIKETSIERLAQRGFIFHPFGSSGEEVLEPESENLPSNYYEIKSDGVTYGSQYQITGGTVNEISYDKHSNSLIVSLGESDKGYLQILIQIGLLHSLDESPFTYFVIVDGEETSFEQLSPILLKIPFEKGTKLIEIIGTNPI